MKRAVKKKAVKRIRLKRAPGLKPERFETIRHADWIEYLANKKIKIIEKENKKTGEKFMSLSRTLRPELRKKILNSLLRTYADADSINRALEDYKLRKKSE